MRALVLVLALTLACAAAALAEDDYSSNVQVSQVPAVGTTGCPPGIAAMAEGLMDACVANAVGLTTQQVTQFRQQGMTYQDIMVAHAISVRANRPMMEVTAAYQRTRDWNQVAAGYNLRLADVTTTPVLAATNMETFNQAFISQYFGVPQSELVNLRQQGFTWEEISMMANAAARTNQPIRQIATMRQQGLTWNDIADRYNIALADLSRCPPMRVVTVPGIIGAGPMVVPPVLYDTEGNPVLLQSDVNRYFRRGFDWLDIAIAANVSIYSRANMDTLLMRVRNGELWENIIAEYGVSPHLAFNVTNWPFERRTIYSPTIDRGRLERIQRYQQPVLSPVPPRPTMVMPSEPFVTTP